MMYSVLITCCLMAFAYILYHALFYECSAADVEIYIKTDNTERVKPIVDHVLKEHFKRASVFYVPSYAQSNTVIE